MKYRKKKYLIKKLCKKRIFVNCLTLFIKLTNSAQFILLFDNLKNIIKESCLVAGTNRKEFFNQYKLISYQEE